MSVVYFEITVEQRVRLDRTIFAKAGGLLLETLSGIDYNANIVSTDDIEREGRKLTLYRCSLLDDEEKQRLERDSPTLTVLARHGFTLVERAKEKAT